MQAVLLKNFFIYRKEPFELLSGLLRSVIGLVPFIVLALLSGEASNTSYTLVSFVTISFISHVSIGVSYEFYLDLISNKFIEFRTAKVEINTYITGMLIIYSFVSTFELFLSSFFLNLVFGVEIKLTLVGFLTILIILPALMLLLFSMSCIGAAITYKTGKFSMIGLVMNMIFFFSGYYSPISFLPNLAKTIAKYTPFAIVINFIRESTLGIKLGSPKIVLLVCLYIGSFVLFIVSNYISKILERKLM